MSSLAITGCDCGGQPGEGSAESQITSPSGDALVSGSPLTISGTASAEGSPLARVEVSFDNGGSWQQATGLESWSYALTAADGRYTVVSRASTEGGAVETPRPGVAFTLDNTPPEVAVTSTQPEAVIIGTSHQLQGSASDANGVAAVELSFDGGATWVAATGAGPWSYAWGPFTADGRTVFKLRARDAAGNVSAPSDFAVVIDREPPTSSITAPTAGELIRGQSYTVTGMAQSRYGTVAKVEFSADDGATWADATGTTSWSHAWTVPADGQVRLRSRATDALGGVELSPPLLLALVDNTGPAATLTPPPSLAVRGTTLGLTGTALDPTAPDGTASGLSQVDFSSDDGATWTRATGTSAWSFTWTLPVDGIYVLKARAADLAGNVGLTSAGLTMVVDNTAPGSGVTSPAAQGTVRGATVTITGTATDNLAGVQLVEVSTDGGGTFGPATGTDSWSFSFAPTRNGIHDVRVRTTDVAGNTDASTQRLFIVDNDLPSCAVANPRDGDAIAGTSFAVSGTSGDGTSGVQEVWFSSDNGATWALAAGTTSWSYTFRPAASGSYTLRCRAVDRAGNETVSSPVGVSVDQSLPFSRITSPANGAALQNSPTISGTASSSSLPILSVQVSFNGGPFQPAVCDTCGGPGQVLWHYDWTAAPEGTYIIQSRASNASDVEQTSPQVTVRIDRTRPLSGLSSHASNSAVRGTLVTLSGFASDSLSGVTQVEISFDDGATWAPVGSGTIAWTHDWTLPADGTYSIRTRATDAAGNVEVPSGNVVLKVDNAAPTSQITQPPGGATLTGGVATISGTAADNLSGLSRVEVSTDGGATWTAATGTTVWSFTWTLPADGSYTLQSRAVDLAGNVEAPSAGPTVTVDNTAPVATITDPVAGQNIRFNSYTVQGTAGDGAGSGVQRVEVSTDNGASWTSATGTTSWSFTWTTPSDSTPTLRARAIDVVNLTGPASAGVTVRIDKTAPATTIVSPAGGANLTGTGATISGLATDTGSGVAGVDVSLDNGATWQAATLSGNSWSLAWTFGPDGTFTIRSRGRDGAGNVETPQAGNTVKVDNTRPSSAVVTPVNGSATNAVTYAVTGTHSDGAGSGVTGVEVSTNGGTTWAAATLGPPGQWSYSWNTPGDGTYTVRSRATDAVGLVEVPSAGNAVSVDRTRPSSAVVSPANGTSISGLTQVISGTSTDGAGSGILGVEVSTDNGATWGPASGTVSWSFSWTLPAAAGAYQIRSRATDNANNPETPGAGFTYHVLPNVTAITPPSAARGTAVTLTGYRFGATQGGSTVTFNGTAATAVLSWSDTSIRVVVPAGATTGNVVVRVNSEPSPGAAFTTWAPPASNGAIIAGGYYAKLKLDARGTPHVVHANALNGANLLYTTYNPTTTVWSTATIDTNGRYRNPSIAIDSAGVLHVAAAAGAGVRYLRCDPTASGTACLTLANWTAVTAIPVSSGTCGPTSGTTSCVDYTSIALTGSGSPRIAYYDASDMAGSGCTDAATECLKYAAFAATPPWPAEVVDPAPAGGTVGQWASLAIDPANNQPHISYYDGTGNKRSGNKNLVYATKVGTTWGYFSPATTNDVGHFTSIALLNGLPRISHTDITNSARSLNVTASISLGAWNTSVHDGPNVTNVVNGGTSIAVGTDGRSRVAYYSGGLGSLRLATEGTPSWSISTLTTGGFYPSLGLDGLNRARVSYQNGTNLAFFAQ